MVTACSYQPSFFSTLLLSLDFFFKPWAGLPYLCCIHSRVYCADLKSLFFQVLRYQKRGGWSLCPLQAQSKPAIVLLWHPENPLLVQNSFCSSHSIMQAQYISPITSLTDSCWDYSPAPFITVSCPSHLGLSSRFIALSLSFQTPSSASEIPAAVPLLLGLPVVAVCVLFQPLLCRLHYFGLLLSSQTGFLQPQF